MKKTLFTLAFIFVLGASFAQKAVPIRTFKGFINGNIPITLVLVQESENGTFSTFTGTLQYRNNPKLNITGKRFNSNGAIGITERDSNGNITGFFNGFTTKSTIYGTWSNPNETVKYPFQVRSFK